MKRTFLDFYLPMNYIFCINVLNVDMQENYTPFRGCYNRFLIIPLITIINFPLLKRFLDEIQKRKNIYQCSVKKSYTMMNVNW